MTDPLGQYDWWDDYQNCKAKGSETVCHSDLVFRMMQKWAVSKQSLSDEEIKTIIVQHIQTWNSLDSIIEFARAIEERHGIK